MKSTNILLNKKVVETTKIKPIRLSKDKKLIISELLNQQISPKQLNILMNKPISKDNPVSFIQYFKGTLIFKCIKFIINKMEHLFIVTSC